MVYTTLENTLLLVNNLLEFHFHKHSQPSLSISSDIKCSSANWQDSCCFKFQPRHFFTPEQNCPILDDSHTNECIYLGWVLPYKRLMRMCRWIGSHFPIEHHEVAFSTELLEWGHTFLIFEGKTVPRKWFTASKRNRMFVLEVKVKSSSFNIR